MFSDSMFHTSKKGKLARGTLLTALTVPEKMSSPHVLTLNLTPQECGLWLEQAGQEGQVKRWDPENGSWSTSPHHQGDLCARASLWVEGRQGSKPPTASAGVAASSELVQTAEGTVRLTSNLSKSPWGSEEGQGREGFAQAWGREANGEYCEPNRYHLEIQGANTSACGFFNRTGPWLPSLWME